jgi:peptidoglycan/xylan/chitin deacetylase (PgdA/CDA1 family)
MRAILTYHSIDDSGSPISIDAKAFERQVRWLASGRVRVTTIEGLLRLPADTDAVAITFDDGFENFGTVAAPLLRAHGLPVTLFVVADAAGSTNAWGGVRKPGIPTLPLLDWDALGRLADEGVTLGGHGRTHRPLAGLRGAALADEVAVSAERIGREIGVRPRAFAYPYGSYDAAAAATVATYFSHACTTELRPLADADRPHELPRLDAYYFREPGRLERWGSAAFNRHLWVRARARWARQRVTALGRRT